MRAQVYATTQRHHSLAESRIIIITVFLADCIGILRGGVCGYGAELIRVNTAYTP